MINQELFPLKLQVLRVVQPLGEFYITALRAELLLEITYSDPLKVEPPYKLTGAQREERSKRLQDIGRYIDTVEAAFPNSIILGANYDEDGNFVEKEEIRWRVESNDNGGLQLVIPTNMKMASIIDGQHRLHAFREASSKRLSMELLCAIYLDLPNPYQAYLFATINFNQKKVDRSLAYELWGYNLDEEPAEAWSPEKTAVFLCRKLNVEQDSPFHRHIIVAAQDSDLLFNGGTENDEISWRVSTATVVDGILKLISSNPKRDKDQIHTVRIKEGRNRKLLSDDKAPLRSLYLETRDMALYTAIKNYFTVIKELLWKDISEKSYIIKTVGIQALFDVLRILMERFEKDKDISEGYFRNHMEKVSAVDFTHPFFQASGKGRTRIKNVIGSVAELVEIEKLPESDRDDYVRFIKTARQ